nr:MAG TPA: hypothetical protein [Caudoviricetes sp.]
MAFPFFLDNPNCVSVYNSLIRVSMPFLFVILSTLQQTGFS